MVEPLPPSASDTNPDTNPDPAAPNEVYVQMTYDYATGAVTYSQQQLSISASTLLYIDLTTLNPGSGGDARFYGFTISSGWPGTIEVTFPSDPEIQVAVPLPATPDGTYSFMPTIHTSGAGIAKQGTLQLTVANPAASAAGALDDAQPSILVTFDAATGAIDYSPKQISVPASTTETVIAVTIETENEGEGGPATFYGFAIQSGWLPIMSVAMTNSTISIVDPNTVDNPVPGTFGFVTLVQAPPDAPGGDHNPDPTIYNEPIGG